MATASMAKVVKHLRRAALIRADEVGDGPLLEAFVNGRDEAAFETLVRRHGAMVLGVCRRVLGHAHDAEDAFQATFLVLARKARSIVPRDQVGNWLHGVAYRTALHARARLARLRARERQVMDMPQRGQAVEVDWNTLHRILDEELTRLPDKYRAGIILCDLEGRSRREAARLLRLPEGTLSSRLATGRQMLARRLGRHGLVLPTGALAAGLTAKALAAVPPALVASTVKASLLAVAGRAATGFISSKVLTLSQGVLKTMLFHKLKTLTVLVLGMALGAVGVGVVVVPGEGPAVVHAAQAPAATSQRPGGGADEPLDGDLLLNSQIQKELRLSANQIRRLNEAAAEADGKHQGTRGEIKRLQAQIEEMQNRVQKLHARISTDRKDAVGKAAPHILSARAIRRCREIQRQNRGIEQLLKDPRIQRMLKLDDEQMMKIEKALKDRGTWNRVFLDVVDQANVFWDVRRNTVQSLVVLDATHDQKNLAKIAEVLTEDQKRTLRSWIGEPQRSGTWDWLWNKDARKTGK
jgi:RNA polymerase sigma factor (sigma-70 family)